ncbi:hypothetical protein D3C85_1431450 [compost metagenome]
MPVLAEIEVDNPGDMGPAEGGDVSDRIAAARQPGPVGQALVEGAEQFFAQAPVAGDGLGAGLLGEQFEMHALTQNRPHARCVKLQPGNGRPAFAGGIRQQACALFGQVQQDRRRLEEGDIGLGIDQYRDASMGVELEKVSLAMLATVDLHVLEGVGQP